MMKFNEWELNLKKERNSKDEFLATHLQSPIPIEDRLRFRGLVYYPQNPDYKFNLELHEYKDRKVLQIQDTTGSIRNFIRWGEFRFKLGDENCTLQAYKNDVHDERLFVPFKDATNGNETYGAGRYLDLDYTRDRTSEGMWILDFNKAYNPWCAYSKNYSCPYVPPENWLKVPVIAGEKKYLLKGMEEKE